MKPQLILASKSCGGSLEGGVESISKLFGGFEIEKFFLSDWHCLNNNPISFRKIRIHVDGGESYWTIENVSPNFYNFKFSKFRHTENDVFVDK